MIIFCADRENAFDAVHQTVLCTGFSTIFPHFLWKRMINHYISVGYAAGTRHLTPDTTTKERFWHAKDGADTLHYQA